MSKLKFSAMLAAIGIVVFGAMAWKAYRHGLRDLYAYGGYGNALDEYLIEQNRFPDTLESLEEYYNSKGCRHAVIPPPPPQIRPLYLPPQKEGEAGEQLVIVSPEPSDILGWFRMLVFVSPSGNVRCELLFISTARSLFKEYGVEGEVSEYDRNNRE